MTELELATLQKLMEKDDIKGKKFLDKFIWLNTTKPKYEIGDYYEITDKGHKIYGVPMQHKKGKLIEIKHILLSSKREYVYTFELEFETTDGRHLTSTAYVTEKSVGHQVHDNHNIITVQDKYADSVGVALNGDRAW